MDLYKIFFVFVLCLPTAQVTAQQNSDSIKRRWILSGYAESFTSLSTAGVKEGNISGFQYNHNRYGSPKLNHAYIDMEYGSSKIRMKTAVHTGTYVRDNYSAESKALRPILNAYVGYQISKAKNIWIDAGVFPSYIGFESVNAFDNSTLTRSLLAENSPYYLSGIRLNHTLPKDQQLNFFILTGWQRIAPLKGNSLPALGLQWVRKINPDQTLNWSFFAGSEFPDEQRRMRYFNNFYWQGKKGPWTYTMGFDFGAEQQSKNNYRYNHWWSPVLIASYAFNEQLKAAARIEHYNDKSSVIIKSENGNRFIGSGYSLNLDYQPNTQLLFRIEWRKLRASNQVFYGISGLADRTTYLTLSASYRLSKDL